MSSCTPLTKCRICGNAGLELVLDLGIQCQTGIFPRSLEREVTAGPLQLVRCVGHASACGLVQLAHTYDLDEMYGDEYGYRSGLNASMVRHLAAKVESLVKRRPLEKGDLVLDIGSNDGTTLSFYPDFVTRLGIDPTTEKFRNFHPPGVEAVADFFSAETFRKTVGTRKAKIITSISMFYDLPNPLSFVEDIASALADDGIWHLEQSYLPSMLHTASYDTVCHEHLEYYAISQLRWMTSRVGLRIAEVTFNDVNGGSFAVTVEKGSEDAPEVQALLARESFLNDAQTWRDFAAVTARHKVELPEALRAMKSNGKRVFGLGASTKGNVVLQYCGIGVDLLEAIAEVNPDKFGCFTPGTRIPIRAEADVLATNPDVLMVLPWHFRATFLKSQAPFLSRGGALMFPLPKIETVSGQ